MDISSIASITDKARIADLELRAQRLEHALYTLIGWLAREIGMNAVTKLLDVLAGREGDGTQKPT